MQRLRGTRPLITFSRYHLITQNVSISAPRRLNPPESAYLGLAPAGRPLRVYTDCKATTSTQGECALIARESNPVTCQRLKTADVCRRVRSRPIKTAQERYQPKAIKAVPRWSDKEVAQPEWAEGGQLGVSPTQGLSILGRARVW